MDVRPLAQMPLPAAPHPPTPSKSGTTDGDRSELRKAFTDFVGQTLFQQTLASMRKTVGKPAYFHGGRAEEIFQAQLDQVLAEKLSDASGAMLADPMFELFMLPQPK